MRRNLWITGPENGSGSGPVRVVPRMPPVRQAPGRRAPGGRRPLWRRGTHIMLPAPDIYARGGCRARSKALDLGSSLEGVQGFESLPPHTHNFQGLFPPDRGSSYSRDRERITDSLHYLRRRNFAHMICRATLTALQHGCASFQGGSGHGAWRAGRQARSDWP